jgi:hypothetical protein
MWFWPINEVIELVSDMPASQFGDEYSWAGSRFKLFLYFVLIDVRCFRVPPGISVPQILDHSSRVSTMEICTPHTSPPPHYSHSIWTFLPALVEGRRCWSLPHWKHQNPTKLPKMFVPFRYLKQAWYCAVKLFCENLRRFYLKTPEMYSRIEILSVCTVKL